MMLFFAKLEFENLVPIGINSHNIDGAVLWNLRLQLELCHETLDHLEVHDSKQEVDYVL